MIFKVGDAKLRCDIAKNLNKLSLYNKDRENKVWVELNHLPAAFKSDRRELEDKFLQARKDKLKPRWFVDNDEGLYCLQIGNIVHKPTRLPKHSS